MRKKRVAYTMNIKKIAPAFIALLLFCCMGNNGCKRNAAYNTQPVSGTGVKRAKAKIAKGTDGLTVEQRNVKSRLELDNKPGSIKHLYIFSSMTGQCMLYSTVKGKVTSSGKRLNPVRVAAGAHGYGQGSYRSYGIGVDIGGRNYVTNEVLQDDGTYGSSIPYLYWWDSNGKYHQQYVTGGMILHVSDNPMQVRKTTFDLSVTYDKAPQAVDSGN